MSAQKNAKNLPAAAAPQKAIAAPAAAAPAAPKASKLPDGNVLRGGGTLDADVQAGAPAAVAVTMGDRTVLMPFRIPGTGRVPVRLHRLDNGWVGRNGAPMHARVFPGPIPGSATVVGLMSAADRKARPEGTWYIRCYTTGFHVETAIDIG